MGETTDKLLRRRAANVPKGVFSVTPLFVKRARGAVLVDVDGKEYIDFAGGIGVENVGHCADAVVRAIKKQADEYIHTCFHVLMYEPYIELAEKLNAITPGDFDKMTMFSNSGAEAVENGVKIAKYWTERPAIIALDCAFHGRTLMGMSLTSKIMPYKYKFGPFAPEIYRIPAPYCYRCTLNLQYPSCALACAAYLEDFFISTVAADSVAAIIVEPVIGEGGFIVPPKGYLKKVKEICEKHGIVLILDEIQSGMGRTGKMFASEHHGVAGDITLSAKSLGAGVPISAITGRAEIMDKPHVGGLGGTYGGNPIACRAALAVIGILEEESFLEKATALGDKVRAELDKLASEFSIIGEVRGLGPMLAMELVRNRKTKEPASDAAKKVVQYCYEQGLITLSCGNHGNVIRTLMPLVIKDSEFERGISILKSSLQKVQNEM
jgi:4-aminobutyrate aminotransferase / (S)-3-amino-2-methylpropionate transaminase / 5-aminovalerate transaminase